MKYSNFFKLIILAIGLLSFIGCGSSSSSSPSVTESEVTKEISRDSFDNTTGVITDETTMTMGESKETATTINISEGTQFISSKSGEVVNDIPSVKVTTTKKSKESSTTIGFETADGKKVIPTEPITASIPAPAGAKTGDRVQIEVPNGIKAAKMSQKLITVTVKLDGTIEIVIDPDQFKNQFVIRIIVELDEATN